MTVFEKSTESESPEHQCNHCEIATVKEQKKKKTQTKKNLKKENDMLHEYELIKTLRNFLKTIKRQWLFEEF